MMFTSDTVRCVIAALVINVGAACLSWAQSDAISPPPLLQSASSQFVELRPLVETPSLELRRTDGTTVNLRTLRGKVVLLSFWATWCPPCRRELPSLERLQQILGGADIEVVAVSVDRTGRPSIETFLKSIGVQRLRPFIDPDWKIGVRSTEEGSPFILYGMPISYVIDRQGRPTGYIAGDVDWTSREALDLLRHYGFPSYH